MNKLEDGKGGFDNIRKALKNMNMLNTSENGYKKLDIRLNIKQLKLQKLTTIKMY